MGSNGQNGTPAYQRIQSAIREQIAAGELLSQIEAEVHRAECIVFLGFAYHKQNMLLLKPANAMPHKFVFGTGSGMSDADRDVVARELASFFTPNMTDDVRRKRIKIEHLKCAELFDYHSKSLTGGD